MSFSFENLLNDAIKLSTELQKCETDSDNLIFRTENLKKDNQNIKEVCVFYFKFDLHF